MNLAIRGIDANLGAEWADSFHRDQHKDLKADYVLANPPFNDSNWGGQHLREDPRWHYGAPPVGNANFAWVQHLLTPGHYVGAEEIADDDEPFDDKMKRLVAQLDAQFAEGAKLETVIRKNLRELGYGS